MALGWWAISGDTTDHSAICQACRTIREGIDSVQELADELNEKGNLSA